MKKVADHFYSLFKNSTSKGTFANNYLFVFGGKSLIFIFGLLFTPIISRIYDPLAYGTYAFYSSVVVNMAMLVSLKIPSAFVLISSEKRFRLVIKSLFGIAIIGAALVALVWLLIQTWYPHLFQNEIQNSLWHFIGLGIFFHITTDILGNWNVREKSFKRSTAVSITESVSTKIGTIGIGILFSSPVIGQIIGEFIGKFLHILVQIPLFIKSRASYLIPIFSFSAYRWLLREFKEFPLYVLPSTWIGFLANSIVIIFLSAEFSIEDVGSYSMAIGLLNIPVMVIAHSAQPLLMQKVVELTNAGREVSDPINKFVIAMIISSVVMLLIAFPVTEYLINIFLGAGWEKSAQFVKWMLPMIGLQLLYQPLSGVLIGLKKIKPILTANMIRISILSLGLIVIHYLEYNFDTAVKQIIIIGLVALSIPLVLIIKKSTGQIKPNLIVILLVYLLITVLGYLWFGFG